MDLTSRTALLQLQFYELHFELQHNILKLSDGLPGVVNYPPNVEQRMNRQLELSLRYQPETWDIDKQSLLPLCS